MALNAECSKEDIKTHFTTREGVYHLMSGIEYYRPNRINYVNGQLPLNFVHISLINVPNSGEFEEKLCLNIGRELFIYYYRGIKAGTDVNGSIDRKGYKTMNPTCHSFNTYCANLDSVPLLIGFNTGAINIVDIIRKDVNKVFNEEKLVDKSKVTCIKWIPNSRNLFLSSHASGQLYVYNEDLPCSTSPPNYQLFKSGNGYSIHVCKTKSTRNPVYRWVIGREGCCINEFAFSPCNLYLAVVSQDGFLRVFHYDTMELIGFARSYFGGFLCVCWSPDSKYIAVGGEDDLVTIWSFHEKQVVARGQGHHSWVNVVAFDPYTCSFGNSNDPCYTTCYRLGSVGQDTMLCLWDITEDALWHQNQTSNNNSVNNSSSNVKNIMANGEACLIGNSHTLHGNSVNHNNNISNNNNFSNNKDSNQIIDGVIPPQPHNSPLKLTQRFASLGFSDKREPVVGSNSKKHSRNHISDKINSTLKFVDYDDPMKLIGTAACPRFDECPLLEPLLSKKIANERLSALVFKEDCMLTLCYDGSISTWSRPGSLNRFNSHLVSSAKSVTSIPADNSTVV